MHKFERWFLWALGMAAACIPGGLAIHFWSQADGSMRFWAIAVTVVAEGLLIYSATMRTEAREDDDHERLRAIGFLVALFVMVEGSVLLIPARELVAGAVSPAPSVRDVGADIDGLATIEEKRERLREAETAGTDRELQLAISRAGVALDEYGVDGIANLAGETGEALVAAYALLDEEALHHRAEIRRAGFDLAKRAVWELAVLLGVAAIIAMEMQVRRAVSRRPPPEPQDIAPAAMLRGWTLEDFVLGRMPIIKGKARCAAAPSKRVPGGRTWYIDGHEDLTLYAKRVARIRAALGWDRPSANVVPFERGAA